MEHHFNGCVWSARFKNVHLKSSRGKTTHFILSLAANVRRFVCLFCFFDCGVNKVNKCRSGGQKFIHWKIIDWLSNMSVNHRIKLAQSNRDYFSIGLEEAKGKWNAFMQRLQHLHGTPKHLTLASSSLMHTHPDTNGWLLPLASCPRTLQQRAGGYDDGKCWSFSIICIAKHTRRL